MDTLCKAACCMMNAHSVRYDMLYCTVRVTRIG